MDLTPIHPCPYNVFVRYKNIDILKSPFNVHIDAIAHAPSSRMEIVSSFTVTHSVNGVDVKDSPFNLILRS